MQPRHLNHLYNWIVQPLAESHVQLGQKMPVTESNKHNPDKEAQRLDSFDS